MTYTEERERDFDDDKYESWYEMYGEQAFENFVTSLVDSKSFGEGLYDYSIGHLESDIAYEFIQALYTNHECITALSLRCKVLAFAVDNGVADGYEWADLIYGSDPKFIYELLDAVHNDSTDVMNGKLLQLAIALYDECENEFFETVGMDKFTRHLEIQMESRYDGYY